MTYAYVCQSCHHLASRHFMAPDASDVVAGPYRCSHQDCVCAISQADPVSGISEAEFDLRFAPTLNEYQSGT